MDYQTGRRSLAVLAMAFVLANLTYAGRQDLKVVGKIVAYEFAMSDLTPLTDIPDTKILIVRIDKNLNGNVRSRYVRVRYQYMTSTSKATSEIFDFSRNWQLNLRRNTSCDGPLPQKKTAKGARAGEGVHEFALEPIVWVVDQEKDNIAPDQILPCFQLGEGNFKPV